MRLWRKKTPEPIPLADWFVHIFPDLYVLHTWMEEGVTYTESGTGWGWLVGDGILRSCGGHLEGGSIATRAEALAEARAELERMRGC